MANSEENSLWWKSDRSSGGNCVEVRTHQHQVQMRDSKNPDGGVLTFERAAFADFLDGVRAGEFDLP